MKTYLTRAQSRAFQSVDGPVGDPFGGPAYGEKNDPVSALISVGSTLLGGYMSSNASQQAAQTQSNAAQSASENQMQMFNTINDQNAPWRQTGANALASLSDYMGLPQVAPLSGSSTSISTPYDDQITELQSQLALGVKPAMNSPGPALPAQLVGSVKAQLADLQKQQQQYIQQNAPKPATTGTTPGTPSGSPTTGSFTHAFGPADLQTNLAPNYQFMLNQGLGQAQNMANASGGLLSGNTLQGLNTFAQNYASNAYQDAFNNYNTGQTNIFNRLSDLAGLGQTSNQTTAQAGTTAANNSSNYLTSGAAAQAAGIVGGTNAITSGLNNASSMYSLSKLLGGGGGGGYSAGYSAGFNA